MPRLIGAFGTAEDFDVIEPLIVDFEEPYVKRPRRERIRPRPLEPEDLIAPPGPQPSSSENHGWAPGGAARSHHDRLKGGSRWL